MSDAADSGATRLTRHRHGVPVFDYRTDPVIPPVDVQRFIRGGRPTSDRPHIHDFPLLLYVPGAGEVYVVSAGRVVDPESLGREIPEDSAALLFDPAALGGEGHIPWPTWQTHPLLFPFLHGSSDALLRLQVPAERRPAWDGAITAIETELAGEREGYRQAVLAHLTLLLIDLARMAADVVGELRRSGEPLLADVFDVIDKRHAEPLSLCGVARAVGMTPGHLTTVVRRRTGRTVQEWIIEYRMTRARHLLTDTDLSIAEVARRVGISDPGYFTRLFRRTHGGAPRHWRRQMRAGH